jgi:DNA-binding GntR family transcriptional regulator
MTLSLPVETRLVADQVYDRIHQAIMSGELPAGARLRVRDLAAQVGTSVMPVREALRRLQEAGLAEGSPHRGAVVKQLTLEELAHVYEVRLHLEALAAANGAAHISAEQCERMEAEFHSMRQALDDARAVDYLDRDETLLAVLYEAGGNPVLVEMIRSLWRRCRAYKIVGATAAITTEGDSLWRYQKRLIDAARAGDVVAAEAASRESLLDATHRIHRALDEQRAS